MHMDISEGNFGARILNEEAGGNRAYPDQTRPFTPGVRTPQCGHTVWGKTYIKLDPSRLGVERNIALLIYMLVYLNLG
jgi:hypothetical protein